MIGHVDFFFCLHYRIRNIIFDSTILMIVLDIFATYGEPVVGSNQKQQKLLFFEDRIYRSQRFQEILSSEKVMYICHHQSTYLYLWNVLFCFLHVYFGSLFTLAVDDFLLKRTGNVRFCAVSRLLMHWSPINLGYSHKARSLPDVLGN